jgi:hypothetical protein
MGNAKCFLGIEPEVLPCYLKLNHLENFYTVDPQEEKRKVWNQNHRETMAGLEQALSAWDEKNGPNTSMRNMALGIEPYSPEMFHLDIKVSNASCLTLLEKGGLSKTFV